MSYSEMALVDLLDAFASNEPVPGVYPPRKEGAG